MKSLIKLFVLSFLAISLASCSGDKKGRGIDFSELKKELKLDATKEKQFDEITTKYKKLQEQNFEAAKAQGGKMDRVALGIKGEELREKQAVEMAKVLSAEELEKFNKFVDENSRKRPRYDNKLLEKIKSEAQLSNEEFAVVNAANDAFEKAFNDAHDIYHGNNDVAKEYWNKYDAQRKAAIKSALMPEHFAKFEEIVKGEQFKARK